MYDAYDYEHESSMDEWERYSLPPQYGAVGELAFNEEITPGFLFGSAERNLRLNPVAAMAIEEFGVTLAGILALPEVVK